MANLSSTTGTTGTVDSSATNGVDDTKKRGFKFRLSFKDDLQPVVFLYSILRHVDCKFTLWNELKKTEVVLTAHAKNIEIEEIKEKLATLHAIRCENSQSGEQLLIHVDDIISMEIETDEDLTNVAWV